ncbi:hypothetical protein L1049_019359 [Liquidambar formosana]|uniref:F-box domain-containing protein n=1 Tax=Liquidambar formosana TaxID=63359 RepID=A0AAP0X6G4_LIQFO
MKRSKKSTVLTQGKYNGAAAEEDQQPSPSTADILSRLPCHLIVDILLRLPLKTLLSCRWVCKTWQNLLSDPQFAQPHLQRSPLRLLLKTLHKKRESRMLHFFNLQETRIKTGYLDARLKLAPNVDIPNFEFSLLGSCNGLLCLRESDSEDPICVRNPMLGEYITLPKAEMGLNCVDAGFGFSHETNQYKVIRLLRRMIPPSDDDCEAEIYALGEGAWRSIGKTPFSMGFGSSFNTFVNGALHWLVVWRPIPDFIHSFHFGSEQFGVVPAPAEFRSIEKEFNDYMRLGVLGGCLSICDFSNSDHIDIWIMKNYGVKESWSKDFFINNPIYERHNLDYYEPIMILNSGEILVLFNENALVLYSYETEGFDYLDIFVVKSDFHAIAHIPSFVSLKGAAKGKILKVCRS